MQTESTAHWRYFHFKSVSETHSDPEGAAYTFVEMQNQDSVEAAVPSTSPGAPNNGPALLIRGLRKSFADVVAVDGLDL
jgi:hypothetical protein